MFGAATWPSTIDLADPATRGITIYGAEILEFSAMAVSSAGDVNGDGFSDLLIGAPQSGGVLPRPPGRAYVIFGGNQFTSSVTHLGTSSSETLTGTSAADVISGGLGNDILIAAGGADVIYGGAGDDVLTITDFNFRRLDGGNGTDTLSLDGSGMYLDLITTSESRLSNIEIIDMRGSGPHTLNLRRSHVLAVTGNSNPGHTSHTLRVRREADDTISMGTGWTRGVDVLQEGVVYQVFTQAGARLLIEELDKTPPTVTITSSSLPITRVSPIPVTITFSEPVINFSASDLSISNATVSNFVAVNSSTFTLSLTPRSQGLVSLDVAAGVATDLGLNDNLASAQFSRTFDNIQPSLAITPDGMVINASQVTYTFQFDEVVSGFTAGDISITNGLAGTFTAVDGDTYTLVVSTPTEGNVTVQVVGNLAQDSATNGNLAAISTVRIDQTAPGLNITPNGTISNASSITFTFQFTEAVTGFSLDDISLTNGEASALTKVDDDTYTLAVTPTTDGLVTVSVAANVAQDAAAIGNPAASASVTSDRTVPALSITPDATTTNSNPITFTFQFSEPVLGFTPGDIGLTNGSAGAFTIVDDETYTLVVSPDADGLVVINVAANAAQDGAANGSLQASASVTSDRTVPTLGITPNSSSSSAASVLFTFQFSEVVTSFVASDVLLTNGVAGQFTAVDGDTYTLVVTPVADGLVQVDVAQNSAQDAAGNGNLAASASVTFDRTAPRLTITPNGATTNAGSVLFTFQFTESVTGFATEDIVLTNGIAGPFVAVDSETYTLEVLPAADGMVTVSVEANSVQDIAANGNAATAAVMLVDRTSPGLLVTPNNIATNADQLEFTFQFTEAVTGFTLADISVTNGTPGLLIAVDADTYTLTVAPDSDGLILVSVSANAAQDIVNQGNLAADVTVISDRTAPGLNITPDGVSTNSASLLFTFQFTEPVSDFTANDIILVNGVAGTFTAVDADTYTLIVVPSADGVVSIHVGADAAHDAASNGSLTADASVTVDRAAPGLTIAPTATTTNASPMTFTFHFTETVLGFTADDVQLTNGSAGTFTAIDGATYTLLVTPVADGSVSVSVAADRAHDAFSNGNIAANASVLSDRTSPGLSILPNSGTTNASPLVFTFQFTEAVSDFNAGDIAVTGGTAGIFTAIDGDTYTLLVTPTADGTVTVSIAANAAQDSATNGNVAASVSMMSDRTPPRLSISPDNVITNASQVTFTFQFTEPVTGFTASDIVITNGNAGTFTGVDDDTYTLIVTPTTDGTVTVSVAASVAQDLAGNGNVAAIAAVTSDRTTPSVSITPNGTLTNSNAIIFTFQFSELVNGFAAGDVTLINGTPETFTAVDGDTYTLTVSPNSDGPVTASITANAVQDDAANGNLPANAVVMSDRTAPGLNITPDGVSTNSASLLFTFQFTEPVSDFAADDIVLVNGVAGTFTAVDADTYTLIVVPSADGVVSIHVGADAAQDAVSNGSLTADASVTVDRAAPGLTISPNATTTNTSPITFTFQFTETVLGFTADDVQLTNGSAGTFTAVDGNTYTLLVTPVADGPLSVSVAADQAHDAFSNGNIAANASVLSDRTSPGLSILPNSGTTNASPIVFTFQFTEAVSDFNAGDIAVTGGIAGTFTAVDGDTYTLLVTPTSDGTVTVSVAANAAQDSATNGNVAASVSLMSDRTPPSLSIFPDGTTTNASQVTFTFQFTEPVTGFTAGDIVVTNGNAGTFTIVDSDTYTLVVTPTADGAVTVSVAASAAQDLAGNSNIAVSAVVTSDRTSPGVSITPNGNLTNSNTIIFTFQFSESVNGFAAGDVTVINGTPGAFAVVDGDTYTLTVSPNSDGPVTASITANAVQDDATNGNLPATAVVTSDQTAPGLTISPAGSVTNSSSINFTFQFTETVTGFTLADISLTNGLVATLVMVDSDTYTLQVTPQSDGPIAINVAANVAQDLAGNGNTSASALVTSDRTAPTATISPVAPNPRTTAVNSLTIVFSEAIIGFSLSDLVLSQDAGMNLIGGSQTLTTADNITFTLGNLSSLTMAPGSYVLSLNAATAGIHDTTGNALIANASTAWSRINPGVSLSIDSGAINEASGTAIVTATLSSLTDVAVTVVLGFAGTTSFPADYSRSATQIVIPAGSASVSVMLTAVSDGDLETAESINVSITGVTNGIASGIQQVGTQILDDDHAPVVTSPASVSLVENSTTVLTVTATDADLPAQTLTFSITGGPDQAQFSLTSGGQLTFRRAPDFEAPVDTGANNVYSVQIRVNDGHGGIAVQNLTVTVTNADEIGPTVNILPIVPDLRNTPVESVQIVFSEPVSGFGLNDLLLTRNGGTNLLTGSQTLTTADNVTFTLTGLSEVTASDGQYSLMLVAAASGIMDQGGNGLVNGTAQSWQTDATRPTATISAVTPDPRTTAVGSLTIVFSEPITGLELSDLVLARDGSSNLLTGFESLTTTDNMTFVLSNLNGLTRLAGSYSLSLDAQVSGIVDVAGNSLEAGVVETWVRVNPTLTLSLTADTLAEAAGATTLTATLSTATDVNVTVTLGFSGTATFSADYSRSATQIVIPAGSTTGSISLVAVQDAEFEATEAVVIDISNVTGAVENGTQQIAVQITDDDHAPAFTSTVTPSIPENLTLVLTILATDADLPVQSVTYLITGGTDQQRFSLTPTGELTFKSSPDFELPGDDDGNNAYEVQVTANDGHGGVTTQNISVTVTDVDESPQLVLSGTGVTWIKKQPPVALMPSVTVGGLAPLANGTLTIAVDAIGTPKKLLDQFHFGAFSAFGNSAGAQVTNGHLTLQIDLNQNASASAIQSFLRGISFSTKGKGLKATTRTMDVTLSADAGSSTVTQTIDVRKRP